MAENHFTKWLDEGRKAGDHFQMTKTLVMKDGTRMSIQAGPTHYSSPRIKSDSYKNYQSFEMGFPSKKIDIFMEYIDGGKDTDPTETVYGYVPVKVIETAITQCGGVAGFFKHEEQST